jgi:hypothetical protein
VRPRHVATLALLLTCCNDCGRALPQVSSPPGLASDLSSDDLTVPPDLTTADRAGADLTSTPDLVGPCEGDTCALDGAPCSNACDCCSLVCAGHVCVAACAPVGTECGGDAPCCDPGHCIITNGQGRCG